MKLTKEFINAVIQLDKAFANLEEAWDDNHDDSLELCHVYPFDHSLAEIANFVHDWCTKIEACKE